MEGFQQKKIDYSNYETSFRRWLVSEIDSGRMSWQEAREKFKLPHRFDNIYKRWQIKYSDEIHLSLQLMSEKERTDHKALEKRIKELEKQLEQAKMKNIALNTMIDIAENDYKLEIRKKFGPKQ
jgi:LPS O-antigen subunit length determinant protein (WzzB/FepE family)